MKTIEFSFEFIEQIVDFEHVINILNIMSWTDRDGRLNGAVKKISAMVGRESRIGYVSVVMKMFVFIVVRRSDDIQNQHWICEHN